MAGLVNSMFTFVSPRVRGRGGRYFQGGKVNLTDGSDEHADAIVTGTRKYEVHLERFDNDLVVFCDCPYFDSNLDPCKHIWAVILAAESEGYLTGPSGKPPKTMTPRDDTDSREDWMEEEDGYDDDESAWEYEEMDEGKIGTGARVVEHSKFASERRQSLFSRRKLSEQMKAKWAMLAKPSASKSRKSPAPKPAPVPKWKTALTDLRYLEPAVVPERSLDWPVGREVHYLLESTARSGTRGLELNIKIRDRKKNGSWSVLKELRLLPEQISLLPNPEDRHIFTLLAGAKEEYAAEWAYSDYKFRRFILVDAILDLMLPLLCQTGRCFMQNYGVSGSTFPIQWDSGPPWTFTVVLLRSGRGPNYHLRGELRRGEDRLDAADPSIHFCGCLVVINGLAGRLSSETSFSWISLFRQQKELAIPESETDEMLKLLYRLSALPPLELPPELQLEEVSISPRPILLIKKGVKGYYRYDPPLRAELSFVYDDVVFTETHREQALCQPERRRVIIRDSQAENKAKSLLSRLGILRKYDYRNQMVYNLSPSRLPGAVRTLVAAGWRVEAEGKLYRQPNSMHLEVRSGIDWFELHGEVQFDEASVALPALLHALKRGETTVALGDGTIGTIPEEWLRQYGVLSMGTLEEDHVRFRRSQAGFLDALLSTQPESSCDETFDHARRQLREFSGIQAEETPAGFVGELRGYQKDGLGWIRFLQGFGFGGCLADDMGLGKTIQVLALLEMRRELRARNGSGGAKPPGPSLVVAPRSVIFNWKLEAKRFSPQLRILDHTGVARLPAGNHFEKYDVVLTTYGTLRRDAVAFKDVTFDYLILDEAQAIKNSATESAKAARLLQGNHRLALSGTPVENHLGELWSLFEFLNPGMLGGANAFKTSGAGAKEAGLETLEVWAKALRPFILRRLKEQVANELPEKSEETIYCEMEPSQRKLYDELREHYRASLLGRISRQGLQKSKIQVLEALLRLRQAACHPGLIDKSRAGQSSAKLEVLAPRLEEVLDEGHKALVFSQFTSLLAIVKDRLKEIGMTYEYLDGKTRDRQARVERFQNDPACKLFLISLKAGGLGLNLTAAEYVFLLDPWWNPAVEAQAIDRTHRIGQTRPVFAYRLITRNTVEEKILELQKSKRALADAIITADNSLIRNLTREDLEQLLS